MHINLIFWRSNTSNLSCLSCFTVYICFSSKSGLLLRKRGNSRFIRVFLSFRLFSIPLCPAYFGNILALCAFFASCAHCSARKSESRGALFHVGVVMFAGFLWFVWEALAAGTTQDVRDNRGRAVWAHREFSPHGIKGDPISNHQSTCPPPLTFSKRF